MYFKDREPSVIGIYIYVLVRCLVIALVTGHKEERCSDVNIII